MSPKTPALPPPPPPPPNPPMFGKDQPKKGGTGLPRETFIGALAPPPGQSGQKTLIGQ